MRAAVSRLRPTVAVALVLAAGLSVLSSAGRHVAMPKSDLMRAMSSPHTTYTGSGYDWAGLGRDGTHDAVAPNSTFSTTSAAGLGLRWAANLHGAALASPIVSYTRKAGMVAYVATVKGDFFAYQVSTGRMLWARDLGSEVVASPVAAGGGVWVETMDPPHLYKLDPTTGSTDCSMIGDGKLMSSLAAGTPSGGASSVYGSALDAGGPGPIFGVQTSNCRLEWSFTGYPRVTGTWAPVTYTVDGAGTPLVLVGTSDPDDTEYAVNALTGKLVWDFKAPTGGDYDIAAGATISPPGNNGFADGVAYVPSKYGTLYALDLTTGAELWSYTFDPPNANTATETGRSTPALDGRNLVFGKLGGIDDLDAVTGQLKWSYSDPSGAEIISSPAIAGPAGHEVVFCADLAGQVHVLDLATGTDLFDYETGGYVVASPAVSGADMVVSSADGFLDDFSAGGGQNVTALPTTTLTSPKEDSLVANPQGDLVVHGQASDPVGVASVGVAIQLGGGSGPYWDAARRSWVAAPFDNPATLVSPGKPTTAFTTSFPVPSYGGSYRVMATAHSTDGQADVRGGDVTFTVRASRTGPRLSVSASTVERGQAIQVSGSGFAPGKTISLSLFGSTVASTTPGSSGGFSALRLSIPQGNVFGPTDLMARQGSETAVIPLSVENSWVGSGSGGGHSGFEPNDTSFQSLFYIGSNSGIAPAWKLATGGSITATPAVGRNVTYAGTTGGKVIAAASPTGAQWWSWSDPDHAAISGSPAVDPARHRLVVATSSGELYGLLTSGHELWSSTRAGQLGSPAISSTGTVFVTSSAGTVTALNELTGRTLWQRALASPPSTSVALDSADNGVVMTEGDGSVVDLSASSGTTLWSTVLSGTPTAPAVTPKYVDIATSSGDVVELSSISGASIWVDHTGEPVTADPIAFLGQVYVAGSGGDVFGLSQSSGHQIFSNSTGCTPAGLAGVADTFFASCTNGYVFAFRPWGETAWQYQTGSPISAAPAVADGALTIGDGGGNLWAFTPYGHAPDSN